MTYVQAVSDDRVSGDRKRARHSLRSRKSDNSLCDRCVWLIGCL